MDEQLDRSELITVYIAQGLLRAQVIKSKLECANIPVLMEYESVGPVIGITVDGLGEVHIKTPIEQADKALKIIENDLDEATSEK